VWNLAGPEAVSRYTLGVLIAAQQRLDPSADHGGAERFLAHAAARATCACSTARADRMLRTRARSVSDRCW
jgi:dTDP-4-dehydrorhamnose reductase